MPTPRKYHGPCDVHALHKTGCKHCRGWAAHIRRHGGTPQPRAKNPGTSGKTWRMTRSWSRKRQPIWPILPLHWVTHG